MKLVKLLFEEKYKFNNNTYVTVINLQDLYGDEEIPEQNMEFNEDNFKKMIKQAYGNINKDKVEEIYKNFNKEFGEVTDWPELLIVSIKNSGEKIYGVFPDTKELHSILENKDGYSLYNKYVKEFGIISGESAESDTIERYLKLTGRWKEESVPQTEGLFPKKKNPKFKKFFTVDPQILQTGDYNKPTEIEKELRNIESEISDEKSNVITGETSTYTESIENNLDKLILLLEEDLGDTTQFVQSLNKQIKSLITYINDLTRKENYNEVIKQIQSKANDIQEEAINKINNNDYSSLSKEQWESIKKEAKNIINSIPKESNTTVGKISGEKVETEERLNVDIEELHDKLLRYANEIKEIFKNKKQTKSTNLNILNPQNPEDIQSITNNFDNNETEESDTENQSEESDTENQLEKSGTENQSEEPDTKDQPSDKKSNNLIDQLTKTDQDTKSLILYNMMEICNTLRMADDTEAPRKLKQLQEMYTKSNFENISEIIKWIESKSEIKLGDKDLLQYVQEAKEKIDKNLIQKIEIDDKIKQEINESIFNDIMKAVQEASKVTKGNLIYKEDIMKQYLNIIKGKYNNDNILNYAKFKFLSSYDMIFHNSSNFRKHVNNILEQGNEILDKNDLLELSNYIKFIDDIIKYIYQNIKNIRENNKNKDINEILTNIIYDYLSKQKPQETEERQETEEQQETKESQKISEI